MRIAVRDERAGARAAARPDRDAVLLGVADEVPDDEEVARELHLLDDAELERAAARGSRRRRPSRRARCASLEAARRGPRRRSCRRYESASSPSGTWNFGRNVSPSLSSTLHSVADLRGVLQRLAGCRLNARLHLRRRLHEEGVVAVVQPLLVVDRLLLLHAHQDLVRARVVAVRGSGSRWWRPAGCRSSCDISHEVAVDLLLLLEPFGCISRKKFPCRRCRRTPAPTSSAASGAALLERLRDLAAQAGRQADQPLGVLAQERLVDARVVVEALEVPHRVQVREVLPADLVLREQDEVVVAAVRCGRVGRSGAT